uniref:Uncharacterized protein n=1 Tax=Rhizophora mucronata TaxID=61149 RepID=A0A2P2KJY8_RHIMU
MWQVNGQVNKQLCSISFPLNPSSHQYVGFTLKLSRTMECTTKTPKCNTHKNFFSPY